MSIFVLIIIHVGMKWDDIATCVHWMTPFAITIREIGLAEMKPIGSIHPDDVHNIQTHVNEFAILVSVFRYYSHKG